MVKSTTDPNYSLGVLLLVNQQLNYYKQCKLLRKELELKQETMVAATKLVAEITGCGSNQHK
jgi:hypothetical protein